jgi:DegV family protein with EDD domain
MGVTIIVDSCCDVTEELAARYGIVSIPLNIMLGERQIPDDASLNMEAFMRDMKACTGKVGSASPSPGLFQDAFVEAGESYAVTLSGNLSATYSSASLGAQMAREAGAVTHVFDTKSASAGEVLIAVKIGEMVRAGAKRSAIIASIERFIKQMKTYFVLESIDNLVKNGRLSKIKGKIISVLNIKPIMGSDGDGNIALFSRARGEKQIIEKLADTVRESGRETEDACMVIAHCNNSRLAGKLKDAIVERYRFRDILIVPTKGISSLYANEGGLIIAF